MASAAKRIAQIAALMVALYAARRYYRNWGATKEECQMRLPGDELVGDPVVQTTEAVWIDAPPSAVWPWLVQMGQDRGGFYSYQALQNLIGRGFHNADRVHPEWQQLTVGDVVRLAPRMGRRDGVTLSVDAIIPEKKHRASGHATESAAGNVVIPPSAPLRRPKPTAHTGTGWLAAPRRNFCDGACQTLERPDDQGDVAWHQAPGRATDERQ